MSQCYAWQFHMYYIIQITMATLSFFIGEEIKGLRLGEA